MGDSSLFNSRGSDQSILDEEKIREGFPLRNSLLGNARRISTSSDDLPYYTPSQSFSESYVFNDNSLISDDNETCYFLYQRGVPYHRKRTLSPILPPSELCSDNSEVYKVNEEQYLTDDSEVLKKLAETSITSEDIGILERSFIESSSSEDGYQEMTHPVDGNISSDSDYDIIKTGGVLSLIAKKSFDEEEKEASRNISEIPETNKPDNEDLEKPFSQNNYVKIETSSEDDSSSEESSSEESDVENKNKYVVKVKRNDNQLYRQRPKLPENVDFENISLSEARLFMDYLDEDYPEKRPNNVQYFFGKYLFKKKGLELMWICFNIFNKYCFGNLLPDSINLEWNKKLRKTAGTTSYSSKKGVKIFLSDKVCNKPYRIRDTLIHEMCHAASFLIDKVLNDGHGPSFKKWASVCSRSFPKIPEVSRCHNYDIEAKYHYICEGCQQTVKRHSKSLDTLKKICGICRGKFVLHVNGKKVTSITVEKVSEINVLSELLNDSKL
uniref:SprT-like domain-containing protein n=1 Tax=Strongyloides venezuelensis TaxID=75913 RepID=A0A0K0G417_STRVS